MTLVILHAGFGLQLLVATPVAVEVAIVNNFIWNQYWTFAQRPASLTPAFLKYNASCFSGLVLGTITLELLVEVAGLQYLAANLIGVGLASITNFLLSNNWAWNDASEVQAKTAVHL